MDDQDVCETGAIEIVVRPERERRSVLAPSTILARIMTALDHATPWESMQVFDILNARGFDEEPTAGDVLNICVVLELSAGVLLGTVGDDLSSVEDVAGGHADRLGDLN